jgi:hypothetical protein
LTGPGEEVDDPVVWRFFDTNTNVNSIADTSIESLSQHVTLDGSSDLTLALDDQVVLIGDLSNPA